MINVDVTAKDILLFLSNEKLEHEFIGDNSLIVSSFCSVFEVKPKCITWIRSIESFDLSTINDPVNLLIVTDDKPENYDTTGYNMIITSNPKAIYFEIIKRFFPTSVNAPGIAATAVVETKNIGSNVSIGHNSYICEDVTIGNNVLIKHNVVIECPTTIGNDCIIESGVAIGPIGYGYYTLEDKTPRKVPDYGGVRIGDRVSIGANTCIARGTLSDTIIEDDAKIDNLCHIAHNARIGARSYIIALSMVAGSTVIEEDVYIAPGAMVTDNITVGKNSMVGLGAIVAKSVEPNKIIVAPPARVVKENK